MNLFQSIILSIVEGITEFLPISSTGHLILAADLLRIPQTDFVKTFEIAIQLGAIFSVVFLYKDTLIQKVHLWKKILTAFIPTAIVGAVFYNFIKDYLLGSKGVVTFSLIAGGVLLIAFELMFKPKESKEAIDKINGKTAFIIGLFQSVSVIPGVSRAAATIIGGLAAGVNRKTAVEFSFLLAVPTMLAATAYDLIKSFGSVSASEVGLLLAGFLGAFVTASFTIKVFIKFIEKNNFLSFGVYRVLVGIIFLVK
ncbi:undecaprenyl-diphosphatase UppP [Candidatus Woesebacteria bacterium GWB1_43_5]|uniref:Undecaprenyl-diphosphatase n=1 Tax=Candidatus Woesebacteria bacterium GWB1_43_5 TaxID=1802474 RepID=A0A1F7WUC1_9BACT|nr:MAG: undecaprenyl-diphosphatase UppP [Candidatus Woesebacteria bacterium GWB1_43_5]